MARILFTVPPLTGHLNPALAVAAALAERGHDTAWAVHADEIDDKLPARARIYPLDGGGAGPATDTSQVRGLESVRLYFEDYAMPMAERALSPMEDAVRDFRPDVMAVDDQMPAGALVARKLGVPWVSLVTTTASILKMSPVVQTWVSEQYRALQRRHLPPHLVVDWPDFSPHRVVVFSIETLVGNRQARVDAPYIFVGPARGEDGVRSNFPGTGCGPTAARSWCLWARSAAIGTRVFLKSSWKRWPRCQPCRRCWSRRKVWRHGHRRMCWYVLMYLSWNCSKGSTA